ncbi:sensor histidine kinase [Cohnella panacarvi]|uniref:sensor histidine kinase n=1 Tax=Cohnella panacarvi TaxID=400776 RepID=UPI00047B46BB|nr:sensor histidine kinase [Cohnella panacarvi]
MLVKLKRALSLKDVRLRNKMLLVYIVSVFVPVVLTNVIFYDITTTNVKKQKMRDVSLTLEQLRNELSAQFNFLAGVAYELYADSVLNSYLDEYYEKSADYVENYNTYIANRLEKYSPLYQAVQSITIFTNNQSIIFGGRIFPITEEIQTTNWFHTLSGMSSSEILVDKSAPIDSGNAEQLSFIQKMDSVATGEPNKILRIEVHPKLLGQIFSDVTLEGKLYLLEGDRIIYSNNPDVDLAKSNSYKAVSMRGDSVVLEENLNQNYLKNWRIVGEFEDRIVLSEVSKSKEFVLYMAAPNLVVPTLIIIWFTRSLNSRLIRILKQMKRVKNQSFETIEDQESKDEIGQLTGEFNRMTLQVKSLIDDVYVADIQKKELELERRKAQFNALQSQINPHFLFNALETIRMRSLIKNETETAKIIHNMAKIFRTSLTWGKDKVTVSEEMEFIVCFLEIQKYRFEDRMKYNLNIDPAARRCTVPKMMFLPFVENASIHGIEPLKTGGQIDVKIAREEDELLFEIRDNGIGMDAEKVKRFYGYLESEAEIGERIGVQNVIYRLKLMYGDRFRLVIESAPGRGTYISLRIPID